MKFNNKTFEEKGYQKIDKLIDIERVVEVRKEINKIAKNEDLSGDSCFYVNRKDTLGNAITDKKEAQRVWNLCNKSKAIGNIILNEEIENAMKEIFQRKYDGDLYRLSSVQANILYPGAKAQKIHIDTPFPEPIPQWPAKANCIIMIDEFTEENGCTEVVPSSHKQTRRPIPDTADEKGLIKITGEPGDAIITHGNLWHRSGYNKTDEKRIAILCSFCASFINQIAFEETHWNIRNKKINLDKKLERLMGLNDGIQRGARNFSS